MAPHRTSYQHNLDPFAALGICQVQRVERAVHDHLAEQAWHAASRRPERAVAGGLRAWLRHLRPGHRRTPRRHPA